MFSSDFIIRQQENLVDNQKCQARLRQLCNKILLFFTGRYEDTLLHAVAERGHSSIFKLILNEVLNKNPKGHFADTPLHFAAEKGHTGKIV